MSDVIDFVLNFHSGWRYLVMLGTIVTCGYFVYALVTSAADTKRDKLVTTIWAILVDIQVTLGLILFVLYIFDDAHEIKGQQMGHLFTMLLLVPPVVHFYSIYSKRNPNADLKRMRLIGAVAPIVTLVLIIGGILALGGGFELVFGS
ncbi:MAG: hypothetical protein HY862_18245 [Chloroflexi bacterium]|nr:hypothetical protein [Chloroflexota bacterium]